MFVACAYSTNNSPELSTWNALVDEKYYLLSKLVGPTLRYVAEVAENVVAQWMAGLDETELRSIAIDSKMFKGTAKRNAQDKKKGALRPVRTINHSNTRLLDRTGSGAG